MLIDMENGGEWVRAVWLPELYDELVGCLSPDDFGALRQHVGSRFDANLDNGQLTTGVGSHEARLGTGFQAAYDALDRSYERLAQLESLLYCAVAIERPESWGCFHAEEDLDPLPQQTYYPVR